MNLEEMRKKAPAELKAELLKLRKEQFALRLQRATGQAIKPDQFGKVRRNIARLKTVQRQAELGVTRPAARPEAQPAAEAAPKAKAARATKAKPARQPAAKQQAGKAAGEKA